jgi:hypothetical protein
MPQEQKQVFGLQDLPEDVRKFIVANKKKLSAGKKRCPVCKENTPHEKLALVRGRIVPGQSALGPVTPKLIMEAAELPFIEYCTKCGNAPLDPKFLEKQVRSILAEFQKKKRLIDLGVVTVQRRGEDSGHSSEKKEEKSPSLPGGYKEISGGLVIPGR